MLLGVAIFEIGNRFKRHLFLIGSTNDGKTFLLMCANRAFGDAWIPFINGTEWSSARHKTNYSNWQVEHFKARIVVGEEYPDGEPYDDKLLKTVAGGSKVGPRKIYQDDNPSNQPHFIGVGLCNNPVAAQKVKDRTISGDLVRQMRLPNRFIAPEELERYKNGEPVPMSLGGGNLARLRPMIFNLWPGAWPGLGAGLAIIWT